MVTHVLDELLTPTQDRHNLYMRYLIERGMVERYGLDWALEAPERPLRLAHEIKVIEHLGFASYFLVLQRIMQWCREQRIVYGPGRGSVGGSYAAYALRIHEADSLEWGLLFERFLNEDRVAHPDVDIDVSQRHRQRVLDFIREEFTDERTVVLQVAAFARAGARRTIDMVAAAKAQEDPNAMGIAVELKRLLPEGANVTAGTKQDREIAFWLRYRPGRNQARFTEVATQHGWYELLMALDGIQTHLAKHAAGVVIVSREDLKRLPQTSADGHSMMTGYDMYSLEALGFLKIDILGLRTLDIVADAHKTCGGDGTTPALIELWRKHRDDPAAYALLSAADTTGVFQVETSGYRKTLKEFRPHHFKHIVQLNALYRPGALDFEREDGKNMVEVFIDRLHRREPIHYTDELRPVLAAELGETQGIALYQEQSMALARKLAGFSIKEADNLRKAIGKKQMDRMAGLREAFAAGMRANSYSEAAVSQVWGMIEAAQRYSWNLSHAVFYGTITWLCAFFKATEWVADAELGLYGPGKAAFYAALVNSLDEDKDRQADAVAEARQHVTIRPPDINVAEAHYTVDEEGAIVFGLNGIKGMGEANRDAILMERLLSGPFQSFEEFHRRLPSVPINMKLSLVRCGAFDSLESRERLLALVPRTNGRYWTVAEAIKHNCSLKRPRELPPVVDWIVPSERELSDGEMATIGFYVSKDPMADVNMALRRLDQQRHWGGQIEAVTIKTDRNGNEYGRFTLLTNALTKQRCMVFASDWPQCKSLIKKGERIIVRGRKDGGQVIGDGVFRAGDYRHFRVIVLERDGGRQVDEFDGRAETIELAEHSGYKVTLRS